MKDDDEKPLTLSREDLYELVWSKPMLELAKDFGISDVGLAKRCKRLGIPLPGRGYWARFDAGQRPHRPKLPTREPKWGDTRALRVAPAHAAEVFVPQDEAPMLPNGESDTLKRIAELIVEPTQSIVDALVPVKRTAKHYKHPERSTVTVLKGDKSGFIIPLSVSADALDRALTLADTLLRAAGMLKWGIDDPKRHSPGAEAAERESPHSGFDRSASASAPKDEPHEGCLIVEGEEIAFRIEERFREEARVPTAAELAREKREWGYHAPRKASIATGKLRVVRIDTGARYREAERYSWYDRKGRPAETQIKEMLTGFFELSQTIKRRRAEAEEAARKHAEEERVRKARQARHAANARLLEQLETDAGAWHRARYLRRYIRVARQSMGTQAPRVKFLSTTIDFFDWADQFINQLDPLHLAPRTDDFGEERAGYGHSDADRMRQAFARLLGSQWKEAWKAGKRYETVKTREGERCYSYREPSVFELDEKASDDFDDD